MKTPKKITYSILELAFIVNGSNISETFKNSLDLAQKAEGMGYNRFWLAEHHNNVTIASSATSILIGYIAGNTQSIRVGSGGIMLPNHSPLIIAEQFGTLGILYPNRIDLGIGRAPGTDLATAHAIRPDRLQAVNNFPAEAKELKKYFSESNKNGTVRSIVAEGVNVPLYILGSSKDSAHLAAKMGLPYVYASHFSPTQLFEALAIYRREFQPSAYLDKPYTIAGVNIVAAETNKEATENFTSHLRFFAGVITGQLQQLQPSTPMTDELMKLQEHPSVQNMLKYSFVGNKEAVAKQVQYFIRETDVDELMIISNIHSHKDRITSYRITSEILQEINTQS